MMPKFHILYGLVFSCTLLFIFPQIGILGFSLIFLSSVFIDLDHAIGYSIKTGNFNPFKFWKWSKKEKILKENMKDMRKCKYPQFVFHGVEFVLILLILSFYFSFVKFIFIGVLFHLILDYIWIFKKKYPWETKFSQIYIWLRNRKFTKKEE